MIRPSIRPVIAAALFISMLLAAPATALAAAPANDNFAAATAITAAFPLTTGTNVEATVQSPDEDGLAHLAPFEGSDYAGSSVWWTWMPSTSGEATIDTCGSDFDTVLAVYTGAALNGLTPLASNDESCGSQSSVTFNFVSGTTYRIAVAGYILAPAPPDTGTIELAMTITPGAPANDNFTAATVFPGDSGNEVGTNVNATSEASDPSIGGGATVWWKWIPSSNMTVGIRTCGSGFDTVLGVYTGATLASLQQIAFNDDQDGCGNGYDSYVDVSVLGGTTYWILVDGYDETESGAITLQIGAPLPDRDGDGIANAADCAPDSSTRPAPGSGDTNCDGLVNGSDDTDGDGLANSGDCAPNDSTKPNRTGADANCNGVVDASDDTDGDTIANGVDCAPTVATKPHRPGPDVNCNGIVDSSDDSDGDTIANGIDCAPADASKPNRTGTDANCDGVVDVVALVLTGGTAARTFTGGALGDTFNGGTGAETFRGLAGNDRARGNGGNDKLYGGVGNDTNDGGAGADLVSGDAGNDTGLGGAGNDIVSGGAGTDLSRGGLGNDKVACGTGTKDKAYGDAGTDSLNCYDRQGGDLIDGGSGRGDVCTGDKKDIFRGCEKIVKK